MRYDPAYAEAYYNRAVCYASFGDQGWAVEDLRKAAGLNRETAKYFLKRQGINWDNN